MVQIHKVKDWKQWYIYLNLIIQVSKKKEMLYHAIIDQMIGGYINTTNTRQRKLPGVERSIR